MARVRLFGSNRSFVGWSCWIAIAVSVCLAHVGTVEASVIAQDPPANAAASEPAQNASSAEQPPAADSASTAADPNADSSTASSASTDAKTVVDPFTIPLPEKMPAASSKTQVVADDWISKVDGLFGKLLVKPMAAVLFFDFGTGDKPVFDESGKPVVDESGNPVMKKGWLGTSIPFVVVWLLCGGVFLTLRMAFINLRGFFHAIQLVRGVYDEDDHKGDVSHFQALSSALSGTVGLGNIAGVAIAIGMGGPGATFWLIVAGFLGMTSKFAECTLAVMYRKTDEEGRVLGGPMVYLKEGLARIGLGPLGSALGIVFTVLCIGGSFGGGNSFQVVQSLTALKTEPAFSFLNDYPWIYGLLMVVLVGVVIIGGIKSIGNFAGAIVPFMCVAYMAICFAVLAD